MARMQFLTSVAVAHRDAKVPSPGIGGDCANKFQPTQPAPTTTKASVHQDSHGPGLIVSRLVPHLRCL